MRGLDILDNEQAMAILQNAMDARTLNQAGCAPR